MASDSKAAASTETKEKEKTETETAQKPAAQPQLLEEDDEFEEFPAQGSVLSNLMMPILTYATDWDDSATELINLKGGPPGAAKSGGDRLWEDNWDDDDIEEEFNLQLRSVRCLLYPSIA
jgi:26 proteasome complex subunit DSS1